jgi:hypothetical protein
VIWFKQAEKNPVDTAFPSYADSLKEKFKLALQIEKNKFPNTKLAYLTDRIYAGYATSTLNPEPFAYYCGWSVKRLIEAQINGDTSLTYTGATPRVPWLAWGPDLWADGTTPRSDGLTWICPDDYISDGTHPSNPIGRQKVANLLFNFFSTDSTCTPWFLAQSTTGITEAAVSSGIFITQLPSSTAIRVSSSKVITTLSLLNLMGQTIQTFFAGRTEFVIDISDLQRGVYFIKAATENGISVRRFCRE